MNSKDDVKTFMIACGQTKNDFGPQAELYPRR